MPFASPTSLSGGDGSGRGNSHYSLDQESFNLVIYLPESKPVSTPLENPDFVDLLFTYVDVCLLKEEDVLV